MSSLARSLKDSLPPELRAGDARSWSVPTNLAAGTLVFYVLTAVISNRPVRNKIGGAGVAVDASGMAAFILDSATTATWVPGRYQWVAFAVDGDGDRTQLAQGVIKILPDVAGDAAVDPRSFNQKVLDSIRAVIAGNALDDVAMYKIGGRELTKIPRETLLKQEAIFEDRVRRERIRRGEKVPTKTVGITFGGRG